MKKEKKVKVLVVDDKPENLYSMEALLKSPSQEIVTVLSAEEGLKKLIEEEFSCILLDVRMPGMNGFEMANIIQNDPKNRETPILFVTAEEGDKHKIFTGYGAGAVDYLIKPIQPPEILQAKVRFFADIFRHRQEILGLSQALKQSNAELAQFAYIASHELQTPLRHMATHLSLLKEKKEYFQFSQDTKNLLGVVDQSVSNMKFLITHLLKLHQIGNQEIILNEVNLSELFNEVLEIFQEEIRLSQAEVIVGFLPTLKCDRRMIFQVFQNLVSNALKYRPKNRVALVKIEAQETEKHWVIFVKDNGIGIESKDHEKIFRLFHRLHSKEEYPGNGIGLSICKKIIHRHEGELRVESQFGKGSVFSFSLIKELILFQEEN